MSDERMKYSRPLTAFFLFLASALLRSPFPSPPYLIQQREQKKEDKPLLVEEPPKDPEDRSFRRPDPNLNSVELAPRKEKERPT